MHIYSELIKKLSENVASLNILYDYHKRWASVAQQSRKLHFHLEFKTSNLILYQISFRRIFNIYFIIIICRYVNILVIQIILKVMFSHSLSSFIRSFVFVSDALKIACHVLIIGIIRRDFRSKCWARIIYAIRRWWQWRGEYETLVICKFQISHWFWRIEFHANKSHSK